MRGTELLSPTNSPPLDPLGPKGEGVCSSSRWTLWGLKGEGGRGDDVSGVSSRAKILSSEAMAPCMTEYLADRSRMGEKNFSIYWMKATSTPKVTVPFK